MCGRSLFRGAMCAVALGCLFFGVVFLPVAPGILNWRHVGESTSPHVLQAQTLAFTSQSGSWSQTYFFNLTTTLSFPEGGTFSVGNPMLMNVSMKLPEDIFLAFSFGLVDVLADGAVWYGSYFNSETLPPPISTEFPNSNNLSCLQASKASFAFSPEQVRFLLPNRGSVHDTESGERVELRTANVLLDYPAPGQFGLTVSFYDANSTKSGEQYCGFTLRTSPFITVLSNETLDTQFNNAYTLSLALFVIMFAAIQAYGEAKPTQSANKH